MPSSGWPHHVLALVLGSSTRNRDHSTADRPWRPRSSWRQRTQLETQISVLQSYNGDDPALMPGIALDGSWIVGRDCSCASRRSDQCIPAFEQKSFVNLGRQQRHVEVVEEASQLGVGHPVVHRRRGAKIDRCPWPHDQRRPKLEQIERWTARHMPCQSLYPTSAQMAPRRRRAAFASCTSHALGAILCRQGRPARRHRFRTDIALGPNRCRGGRPYLRLATSSLRPHPDCRLCG